MNEFAYLIDPCILKNNRLEINYYELFQVGGHTRLLLLNQNTICKPLNRRELDFYRNIPQDIHVFVPQFKGKIVLIFII